MQNILLFKFFLFKKKKRYCVLGEKSEKPFLTAKSLLKARGRLATKMNITFFMGNEVLNIFSSNNFFDKSNIFQENSEKQFLRDVTVF